MIRKSYHRLFRWVGILSAVFALYHFAFRPWMLDWGAPQKIQSLELPGDHFTKGQSHTRAVLIRETPEKIWPWIIQLGQERGGFYSYAWLENIFRADMKNVYVLTPALQKPRMSGDTIWLANKKNYNGKGYQILVQVIPNSAFVMVGGEDYQRILSDESAVGSWSIYLYQESQSSTWLIARSSGDEPLGNKILRYFTFELPHFIMEQKMLRKIKSCVENSEG